MSKRFPLVLDGKLQPLSWIKCFVDACLCGSEMVGLFFSLERHSQMLMVSAIIFCISTPVFSITDEGLAGQSVSAELTSQVNYAQIQSILEKRCIVCHGCYDAPCQLKLSSYTGAKRGASKIKVYDGERITAIEPTRLFKDAQSIAEWRQKGFYQVLNGLDGQDSILAKMLALKQTHPQPTQGVLPDSYSLGLKRKEVCPKPEEWDEFSEQHPNWGMPYAMPNLAPDEYQKLLNWAKQGGQGKLENLNKAILSEQAKQYELYLNQPSLKHRLMSRYIYEHLFLGHLHFSDNASRTFFQLVRSKTPPGRPIELIVSNRPYDDPKIDQFYYRLRPVDWSLVDKDHLVYRIDKNTLKNYQAWFISPDYEVDILPGYELNTASNPFITFAQIPAEGRYRFMLDQAKFIIEGFIKGPVCRGQVALNVIEEQFWVLFFDPDKDRISQDSEFLAQQAENLALPSEEGVTSYRMLSVYTRYQNRQSLYLEAKQKHVKSWKDKGHAHDFTLVWQGDGQNPNAFLTIFRNQDSATVLTGLHGKIPKTAWVIDYPLLERIQYLLVSGFDVYGNIGHQLNTRLYMDFLRMEGENNFLSFLPESKREALRNYWYRNTPEEMIRAEILPTHTSIDYQSDQVMAEFFAQLRQKPKVQQLLSKDVLNETGHFEEATHEKINKIPFLQTIAALKGEDVSAWPEVSFLKINLENKKSEYYTLILNKGYYNVTSLLFDKYNQAPKENSITVLEGLQSSYPNQFFEVEEKNFNDFIALASSVKNQEMLSRWVSRFGIRRTDNRFWQYLDGLHFYQQKHQPLEWGLFDLNRYRND